MRHIDVARCNPLSLSHDPYRKYEFSLPSRQNEKHFDLCEFRTTTPLLLRECIHQRPSLPSPLTDKRKNCAHVSTLLLNFDCLYGVFAKENAHHISLLPLTAFWFSGYYTTTFILC